MRTIVIVCAFALSGCGLFTTGEGSFTGRVVDVSWEGLLFKSCEVSLSKGEQGSQISEGSSLDKALCDLLKNKSGEVVTVTYKTYVPPCCLRTDTRYILESVK